ncbi:MAG: phosphoribosylanthranilate isomerase [Candidatus Rokubacteria bacterium]|nr:phosphoribosylanthranilate isomerase [Candidatus Rokubacteria bacterium]
MSGPIRIKMCGITSAEDARLCVDAGADALGFIFVEGTPRFIEPRAAAAIIAGLPPFVTTVGVFWDHPLGHVKAVAEECGLGALQFHGDEPPEALLEHRLPAIKTIKVGGRADLVGMARYRVAAFLLDSRERWSEGEARTPIPWTLADEARGATPIILSAGLRPENVAAAIRVARPHAVDVDSGIEARPGKKDAERVRRFVAAVRAAAPGPT